MKKLFILFSLFIFFTSCSFFKNDSENKNLNTDTSEILKPNTDTSENTSFGSKGEYEIGTGSLNKYIDVDLAGTTITNNDLEVNKFNYFDIMDGTLLYYDKMIANDYDFFKNEAEDELIFFYVFRNYVLGDNYEIPQEMSDLFLCLDGKKDYLSLTNDLYFSICKGENKYIEEEDSNFYGLKDSITKFKKIFNGENISCDYFLNTNYDHDSKHYHYLKLNDYLFCNKIKDINNYSIPNNLYFYQMAIETSQCGILLDTNLQTICENELENYSE